MRFLSLKNSLLKIERVRHETEHIHRQIDVAKLRLTTDAKVKITL